MTLIELLVVIIIMTTIVAAAIPLLSPAGDDRRLREATRGLNTFITGAQTRAIAINRPFGIALKRLGQDTKRAEDNGVCLELFYVEQPAPYAGFDANSRAAVALYPEPDQNHRGLVIVRFMTRGTTYSGLPPGWAADLFPAGMIRPGDVIEINGTRFEFVSGVGQWQSDPWANIGIDPDTRYYRLSSGLAQIIARPINDSGQQINPKYDHSGAELGTVQQSPLACWTDAAPYKVLRQAAPTSDEPYQLPEGTAIDLRASGVGPSDYFYVPGLNDNSDGVLIMFTPEGRVARVSYSQAPVTTNEDPVFDQPVTENVFLLVGKREIVPAPSVLTDPTLNNVDLVKADTEEKVDKIRAPLNWLSGYSRWVVIGSQSGRIATIENAMVNLSGVLSAPQKPFDTASQSTEELRSAQILAAREFTREMAQLGGR